jgi:nitrite reductase (NADH) small subunit
MSLGERVNLESSCVRVCAVNELRAGERKIIRVPGVGSIGVFNVHGEFYALKSNCPHQGAPLCEGPISGTTAAAYSENGEMPTLKWERDGEILRCPWHAWEFDILTGLALCDAPWRVATYPVEVEAASGPASRARVETYQVDETEGVLWVVLKR